MAMNLGDIAKAFDTVNKTPSFIALSYVGDDFTLLVNVSTIRAVEFGVDLGDDRPYATVYFNYEDSEKGRDAYQKVTDEQSIKNLRNLYHGI